MKKFLILLLISLFSSLSAYASAYVNNSSGKNMSARKTYMPRRVAASESDLTKEASQPNFGPYMRELQRKLAINWDPPKGREKDKVVLIFTILKDGRLKDCKVFKSSGYTDTDKAAILAVKHAAPFRPLPSEYNGDSITVQFTFDYNVFGASIK